MKPLKTLIALSTITALGVLGPPAHAVDPEVAAVLTATDDVDGATTVITAEAAYANQMLVGSCNIAMYPAFWGDVNVRCWVEDVDDAMAQYYIDFPLSIGTVLADATWFVYSAAQTIGTHQNLKLCVEVSRGTDTTGPVCTDFLT